MLKEKYKEEIEQILARYPVRRSALLPLLYLAQQEEGYVSEAAMKEKRMIDLGWAAPRRRVDAGTARRGILWQHERLRALLERARELAEAALDGRPLAPDAVASAGLTLDSLNGWFGSLRWRYFGERALIEDNTVRSRSTSLVNARVGYMLTKEIRAYVDVFNLFDSKDHDIDYFYTSRLPGEPLEGVADLHFHPVEGRAVRLTLALTF